MRRLTNIYILYTILIATMMIVDCGGNTVDLTSVTLLDENQFREDARTVDYCGSAFIDYEFIKHLTNKLGEDAINLLRKNYYGEMQYIIQEFCRNVKFPFTGEDTTFTYEIDLEGISHILLQKLTEEEKRNMENTEWFIRLDYETIKKMFDDVIDRIIRLIEIQLVNCSKGCSTIFLVGGFSQSGYLQRRIKQKFENEKVYVPKNPIIAVSRGAAIYGRQLSVNNNLLHDRKVSNQLRILRYTYGIRIHSPWKDGDPLENKGRFHVIGTEKKAKRGSAVDTDEEFIFSKKPTDALQVEEEFEVLYSPSYEPSYCAEPGVCCLGKFKTNWSNTHLGFDRSITFKLIFGESAIIASAICEKTGQYFQTSFDPKMIDD
jgi:molecular chaperone DnaK (HSP70)